MMASSNPTTTAAKKFMLQSIIDRYSYNFSWLQRPIIQYPQDMVAFQEIVANSRPDLIIETGIAHGGSVVTSRLEQMREVMAHWAAGDLEAPLLAAGE